MSNDRADLRKLSKDLATPGILPAVAAPVSVVTEGPPTDADFPKVPLDRTLAYDREGSTLYIRDEDEWKPL